MSEIKENDINKIEESDDNDSKDIFDRLMGLPPINRFEEIYYRHKEVLLYLFFGGLSFVISIGTYAIFNQVLGINELIANIISWIAAVSFAFITNRTWVFESYTDGTVEFIKQMGSFFAGRIFTLVVEELILFVFITCLHFSSIGVKTAAQIVVILLNYVISKLLVFRKS